MTRGLENPTFELVQTMIRGQRCGMCGRGDLSGTAYAQRNGRIVDVPRAKVPRLCLLCASAFASYDRSAPPAMLHETPAYVLADALASLPRPASFTLVGYASVTPEQWHDLAAGYLIVQELWRRALDCARRMHETDHHGANAA